LFDNLIGIAIQSKVTPFLNGNGTLERQGRALWKPRARPWVADCYKFQALKGRHGVLSPHLHIKAGEFHKNCFATPLHKYINVEIKYYITMPVFITPLQGFCSYFHHSQALPRDPIKRTFGAQKMPSFFTNGII
jgi:hypothetical protein